MYQDLVKAGACRVAVPQCRQGLGGVQLLESAACLRLTDLRDGPPRSRARYTCTHKVDSRVRILRVLNPAAFADKSTYLQVECEELLDNDLGEDTVSEERSVMNTLYEVAAIRERTGHPMRRLELSLDARGRPVLVNHNNLPTISEDSLDMCSASRDRFWRLASLWEGYCERRVVSLRQELGRIQKAAARRDDKAMPPEQAEELQRACEAELDAAIVATTDFMQGLLQADSHASRLKALLTAAGEERERLAAAAAMQAIVGGELRV